jgi:hypothetical protein
MEPEVLIEAGAPGGKGGAGALVEDDGRVVYLYVRILEGGPLSSVWVQNRIAAPAEVDLAGMKKGQAPLMPRAQCRCASGEPALKPANLRLVWLPEGNGVALFDGSGLLAALVPSRAPEGFAAYARGAVGQSPLASELPASGAIERRFAAAEAYRAEWDRSPDPWQRIQPTQLAAYDAAFGKESRYFAIDGGEWPPRGLIRVDRADGVVLATVGMAVRPQPAVELATDHPESLRRIELGIVLPARTDENAVQAWSSWIAGQSTLPWSRNTWLGPGHTLPCAVSASRGFPAVLLATGAPAGLPVNLPEFDGDPVTLLWATPITAAEWEVAKSRGSAAVLATLTGVRGTRA